MKRSLICLCVLLLFQVQPAHAAEAVPPTESAAPVSPDDVPPAGALQANAEYLCFVQKEILEQPPSEDCEGETIRNLIRMYPHMPPEQRAQFHNAETEWPEFRKQWQSLGEEEKKGFREVFKAMLQQSQPQ